MRTTNRKIREKINNAMTVGELMQQLEGYDKDALVVFATDYGDYGHTIQALPVKESEEMHSNDLYISEGYSRSGVAVRPDDGEREPEEWEDEVNGFDVVILQ
jgi:hypothetical protein